MTEKRLTTAQRLGAARRSEELPRIEAEIEELKRQIVVDRDMQMGRKTELEQRVDDLLTPDVQKFAQTVRDEAMMEQAKRAADHLDNILSVFKNGGIGGETLDRLLSTFSLEASASLQERLEMVPAVQERHDDPDSEFFSRMSQEDLRATAERLALTRDEAERRRRQEVVAARQEYLEGRVIGVDWARRYATYDELNDIAELMHTDWVVWMIPVGHSLIWSLVMVDESLSRRGYDFRGEVRPTLRREWSLCAGLVDGAESVFGRVKGYRLLPRGREHVYSIALEDLSLSVRAYNVLKREGINTVGDLMMRSEADLIDFRNFGQKPLDEVKAKLEELEVGLREE